MRTPRCGQGRGRGMGDGLVLNIRASTGRCSPAAGHTTQQQQLQLLLGAGSLVQQQLQETAAAAVTVATYAAAGWDAAGALHRAGDCSQPGVVSSSRWQRRRVVQE